jgi:SpoVK/Ycf46/Vps4 family AAA+-type ATPase
LDLAIRRPGRFDVILQVMPPSCEAKLESVKDIKLKTLLEQIATDNHRRLQLAALTFDEFKILVKRSSGDFDIATALNILDQAYQKCTLTTPYDEDNDSSTTWESVCTTQASKVRLPQ